MQNTRRLHGAWYALSVVPVLAGVLIMTLSIVGLMRDFREMPRVVVPGDKTMTLRAGDYVGYIETDTIVDGVSYSGLQANTRCTLVDSTTGEGLTLTAPTGSMTYNIGSYSGRKGFDVTIPHDGDYTLSCPEGTGVIAIGHGILRPMLLGMFLPLFGGLALGGIALFVVYRRRRVQPIA